MPKKDAANAVLGMLSSAGAQTRPAPLGPVADVGPASEPEFVEPTVEPATASVSNLPMPPASAPVPTKDDVPRTMRLRLATAHELRAAWLEAKRDDVLLTAQDFASTLVEEALAARSRRSRAAGTR